MVLVLGAIADRIDSFIRKDLLSVFLPGFVTLVETLAPFGAFIHPSAIVG
jgi:hypothetical protein